jgi:hypothetical protein
MQKHHLAHAMTSTVRYEFITFHSTARGRGIKVWVRKQTSINQL